MRSSRRAFAVAGAMLFLASCNSATAPTAAVSPGPGLTPAAATPVRCPLTGRAPQKGVDVRRPAVAVKIENSPAARPQRGLDKADIVYEELVEGAITRFAAIFQCNAVKRAGPVRSARFDDPDFIKPITRSLAFAGANAIVTRSLVRHRMKQFTDFNDAKALFRVPPGNTSEHSLFANVKLLLRQAKQSHLPRAPVNLFRFGPPARLHKTKRVDLRFEDSNAAEPIQWRWRKGLWKRYESGRPFLAAGGGHIGTPNLLIERVDVQLSSKIVDILGNPSPRMTFSGRGQALLFRNGGVIKGTWLRRHGRFVYRTASGKPFTFSPGRIWVELLPSNRGAVTGTISF